MHISIQQGNTDITIGCIKIDLIKIITHNDTLKFKLIERWTSFPFLNSIIKYFPCFFI